MTVTINIIKKQVQFYNSAGSVVQYNCYIANEGFDNDAGVYSNGAVYDSSTPDGVTYFSSLNDATAYLDAQVWNSVLANLNGNTYDPQAGNYVTGSFVEYKETLQHDFDAKQDAVSGKGLSTNDYTTSEKSKLGGIAVGATANDTDANLKNRANHTGTQSMATISGLNAALALKYEAADVNTAISTAVNNLINSAPGTLDTLGEIAAALANDETTATALAGTVSNKVDKVSGKGLSTNDYTSAEKTKLANLTTGKMVSGVSVKSDAFPYLNHATVASGSCVFQLTDTGLAGGNPIFPNGVDQDSINFFVNDSANLYTFSYVLSNSNKTLTVTAKKLNLLALGLSNADNGTVVKLLCLGN